MPEIITITPELTSTTLPLEAFTATLSPPETPTETVTRIPTRTAELPTPTETPQATLDLPTEQPNAPARISWTGLPTYPGDSAPGYLFRVDYDPDIWAQTADNIEEIVLAHREIPSCTISAWAGRGLPLTWKVETESRQIAGLFFNINTVLADGNVQFVTFVISDKRITTAFRLDFSEQPEACLQAAEKILLTLRSFASEPTATPTP